MTANPMTSMLAFTDEASAALIIQLQIQDSQQLSDAYWTKGKGREGELSDFQLAAYLYREDLQRNATQPHQLPKTAVISRCNFRTKMLLERQI